MAADGGYIPTIGLEVHAQLRTASKMFCACAVEYGAPPNSLTCPVCLGLPGSLPALNARAIEMTVLAGLMLECRIPEISKWDRKNYFYPDMPKNYQISQFDLPLCVGGAVPLYDHCYPKDAQKDIANPGKAVRLTRIHLEEDVAKSTHRERTTTIDFNRAGTPLMEIVSEPDIESPDEAAAYLSSLRQILLYGGVSDADMEKGQMRCDVNVSVRRADAAGFGAKIELKNLNSISAVRRALRFEIDRQIDELERGIPQVQSTRRWDDDRGETALMRTKEEAHDYRYFPDPDLLPVRTAPIVDRVREHLPELPHEKAVRFVESFGVSDYDASVLSSDRVLADYFEHAVRAGDPAQAKKTANWIINDLQSALKDADRTMTDCPVPPAEIAGLVKLVEAGKISGAQGKEVFAEMFASGKPAAAVVEERGLEQVSDTGELDAFCERVIAENPAVADDVRSANDKAINFLTGQVMKLSRGKANPKAVGELLRGKLR